MFYQFYINNCKFYGKSADSDKIAASYIPFYSIPITLEGRWGTTDKFATIPFHLDLFSAALVELAKSIPVHSLILSSHLILLSAFFSFSFHCAL